MKTVLPLLFCLASCTVGPGRRETTVYKDRTVTVTTWTGGTILTKSDSMVASFDPRTGVLTYRTKGNNETTVPSKLLTSEFIRKTIVPIATDP